MRKILTIFFALSAFFLLSLDLQAQESAFNIKIINPENNSNVGVNVTVEGTAIIPTGNYIWALARRVDFEPLWWPQREVKVNPKNNQWRAGVVLGVHQDIGWDFDIGIITVDQKGHEILMNYWTNAMKTGDFKPIEIPKTTSAPIIIQVHKTRH